MVINSFWDLFEQEVKDIYSAEQQVLAALPKMVQNATSTDLREALGNHLGQSQRHISRLEECCVAFGFQPTGSTCDAMKGIIEEANKMLVNSKPSFVLDCAIIANAQRVEHYEICAYGTLVAFCEALDFDEQAKILQDTLDEEGEADEKLNDIALDEVNSKAIEESGGREAILALSRTHRAELL